MSTLINLNDLEYKEPKPTPASVPGRNIVVNPLYDINSLSSEFLELYNNLELYYAPKKILTFEDMSREQIKNHLMTIMGLERDEDFCNIYAGVLKRDYTGQYGDKVMTPKEAKNYLKRAK